MTAYAYLRKSSVHDPKREVSHEVQESAVRELAARHGDTDLTILSDWDKSGRLGADKRPGYRALLDAIGSGQATAVYSYSLSRLARSVPELSRLVGDCVARGVAVRLAVDAVDTTTASGRLLTHVLASVAAFEADVASERVLAANAAKRARGERVGSVTFYGEREGEDIDGVLAAFREARSFSGAARLLNERGVKTRTSTRGWWPSSVAHVVTRVQGGHRRKAKGVRAGGSDFTLAGLLRCPTCGTRLTGTRDRDGKRVRYSCRLGSVRPHARVSVSEHLILPAIREEVGRLVVPEEVEQVDQGQARHDLEERKARVLDMFEAGHIDRDERESRLIAVYDAMERLDAKRTVVDVPEVDWSWPPRLLNRVLTAIFSEIHLTRDTFAPEFDDTGNGWWVPEWRRPSDTAE